MHETENEWYKIKDVCSRNCQSFEEGIGEQIVQELPLSLNHGNLTIEGTTMVVATITELESLH